MSPSIRVCKVTREGRRDEEKEGRRVQCPHRYVCVCACVCMCVNVCVRRKDNI